MKHVRRGSSGIIGSRVRQVTEAETLDNGAGDAVTNEAVERAFQIERSGQ